MASTARDPSGCAKFIVRLGVTLASASWAMLAHPGSTGASIVQAVRK
jgi:hypothetical protein